MRYYTPLRYPGGKGNIGVFMQELVLQNRLSGGIYVEPYAGGAAVALKLVMTGYVAESWLNDIDPAIHAFWDATLNHTDALVERIRKTPLTLDEWHRQREIYFASNKKDPVGLGFATLFLNRTNRSGILGGGVIGGLDQKGKWLIDARFNRDALEERVRRIETYRHRIKLDSLDAASYLKQLDLPERALVYLDPPYFRKGKRLYRNHYQFDDHKEIAKTVTRSLRSRWVVSYDDVPEIIGLYKNHRQLRYAVGYSAQTKGQGGEVMFFSRRLTPPMTSNPSLFGKVWRNA